jgi:hypothetical protein
MLKLTHELISLNLNNNLKSLNSHINEEKKNIEEGAVAGTSSEVAYHPEKGTYFSYPITTETKISCLNSHYSNQYDSIKQLYKPESTHELI